GDGRIDAVLSVSEHEGGSGHTGKTLFVAGRDPEADGFGTTGEPELVVAGGRPMLRVQGDRPEDITYIGLAGAHSLLPARALNARVAALTALMRAASVLVEAPDPRDPEVFWRVEAALEALGIGETERSALAGPVPKAAAPGAIRELGTAWRDRLAAPA